MFSFTRIVKTLFVAAFLVGTGSVWAQSAPSDSPSQGPAQAPAKGSRATLPESVRRVERQTGGEVLRAEPMQRDGREVYRLKVLTADGRVRVVQDDPSNPPTRDRPAKGRDKQKQSSSDSDEDPPQ
jgi:hypothetical protein